MARRQGALPSGWRAMELELAIWNTHLQADYQPGTTQKCVGSS
jgi:hypothetical protein